jgi:chemotaxis protein methyltransferase CheR
MLTIRGADVGRFRAAVAHRLGLHFDETKLGFLADVLRRRLDASSNSAAPYLNRMEGASSQRAELGELAKALTVNETYFFRHFEQFRAFLEVALPDRISARSATRRLSVLSAGCASGEEAYSLAILARDSELLTGWNLSIRAVDINPAMLERAARACFSEWSLRETPAETRRRWFISQGRNFALDPAIRAAVTFELHNLAQENSSLWQPASYDVIFCRNVMMYFTPESRQRLVDRLTEALTPGGYLFLGHAENLRGLSQDFHLLHTHETFYYQRKEGLQPAQAIAPDAKFWSPEPTNPRVSETWATTWIETVQHMARRIHVLTAKPSPSDVPAPVASSGPDLCLALELLRTEHFEQALQLLEDLDPAQGPDFLLLRAVLLTHSGKIAAAAKVCSELLQLDEFNAGAHYILAVCQEGEGNLKGALDHDQRAAYLDPTFAMPHLHLGLLARRGGDQEAARLELAKAFHLLRHEEASRLLLFGGGFSRDALVALCSRELDRLGSRQ